MLRKLVCGLLALFLIPFGLLLIMAGTFGDTEPEALSSTSFFSLEAGEEYHVQQLTVWDHFYYDTQEQAVYFRATVGTAEHEAVAVAFVVEEDQEAVFWQLEELGPEQPVTLDCVVEAEDYLDADGCLLPVHDVAMEALASATDKQIPMLEGVRLVYFSADMEAAQNILKGTAMVCWLLGAAAIGLAVLLLRGLFKKKPQPRSVTVYAPPPRVRQQLERYQTLVDAGLMTKEEFEKKRREILRM